MSLSIQLAERSQKTCELCESKDQVDEYLVPPRHEDTLENTAALCGKCKSEFELLEGYDANHWRCLNNSMWSEVPAIQVLAYRMLKNLESNDWAVDLVNMMYLDEDTKEWAELGVRSASIVHKDSNGNILQAGDSVVLIKDLKVKGASFIAKRGTAVRRISLVQDNAEHIEGKVEGQHIVILTQYVKKT